MDILCPVCSEPWSIDSLHQRLEDQGVTKGYQEEFSRLWKLFRSEGCKAFQLSHNEALKEAYPMRLVAIKELYFFMGDDLDGCASMLSDIEMYDL